MNARIILPAIAALTLLAAPASAQTHSLSHYATGYASVGYDPQGGGGAGPYASNCRQFANFNQRERCTDEMAARRHGAASFEIPIFGQFLR